MLSWAQICSRRPVSGSAASGTSAPASLSTSSTVSRAITSRDSRSSTPASRSASCAIRPRGSSASARAAASRPVLLALEDLHWANQSTLELLAFLVRSLREVRVLLVATYRSDEMHRRHPLRPLLISWERVRSVHRVELPRFGRDEVAAQLEAILAKESGPELVDLVCDRSGGNAFLVEELAGMVRAGGDPADLPPSLRDVLLGAPGGQADARRHDRGPVPPAVPAHRSLDRARAGGSQRGAGEARGRASCRAVPVACALRLAIAVAGHAYRGGRRHPLP